MQGNKFLKNTGSLMIFQIAKIFFPFITLPYLTRVLSTDAYGTVAYIKTVMNYLQIAVDFGFVLSATKAVVASRANKQKLEYVIGDTLLAKVILGGFTFLVLICMINMLPILGENALYTCLSFAVVFASVFLMDHVFRGLEIMHVITIRFVLMKLIALILTFIFVKSDKDILLIPIFDLIGSILAVIWVIYELKKLNFKLRFSGIKKSIEDIKESFIYFLNNVSSTSLNALSTLIIGGMIGKTEVAYWSVCMQVINAIQACYTPFSDSVYPEMIRTKKIRILQRIIKILTPIVVIGCIIMWFASDAILYILGGKQYTEAVPVMRILIPTLLFGFYAIIIGWPGLGAIGKAKETSITTTISLVVHVVLLLTLALIDRFTLVNVAIVRTATEFTLFITRYYFFRKYKYFFVQ